MVKRDEKVDTNLGHVRDTERKSVEPRCDDDADGATVDPAAYYRPEMGTVVVTNYPRDDS